MASIGPQLPRHPQKRKRTPEVDAPDTAPPTKANRRDNEDEIALNDSDSDDGFGPSAPAPAAAKPAPSIGPSLPPQPERNNSSDTPKTERRIGPALPPTSTNMDEIDLNDDTSDSDTGPAPPPRIGPTAPPTSTTAKRTFGPAPSPAPLSERPPTDPNSEPDSGSDSDWGPALPSVTNRHHGPSLPVAAAAQAPPESTAPKRDEWMMAPPTSSGYRAPDPTKLKTRKFASGRSASEKPSNGISSIWTETPEEKARRLANAVLGREDPSAATAQTGQPSASSRTSSGRRANEDKIRAFTEQTRGRSLVEEHQAARQAGKASGTSRKGDEEEDDPSKRAFDWEKDMKVGGQISNSQRRQLLAKAADFGGRFQKGSYL